jgi:NADH-ubiquinone oxidoreductase chain 1
MLDGLTDSTVLATKTAILVFTFIWIRASFPRIRFDQLMSYCWTILLPLVIALILLVPCLTISFEGVVLNV